MDFPTAYATALTNLDAYIESQQTEAQKRYGQHRKHHLEINKGYFQHWMGDRTDITLCKGCGCLYEANYDTATKKQMLENGMCFHCNHWKQDALKADKTRIIANGEMYGDGGRRAKGTPYLGFAGHEWTILKDGKCWRTNNLWSGGTIPFEWTHILADNAVLLTNFQKTIVWPMLQGILSGQQSDTYLTIEEHADNVADILCKRTPEMAPVYLEGAAKIKEEHKETLGKFANIGVWVAMKYDHIMTREQIALADMVWVERHLQYWNF